jgi:hypothetical protein
MRVQDAYRWEALMADKSVINADEPDHRRRASLIGCVKFSLYPNEGLPLPQHDIVGVKMERHFCRGFIGITFNQKEELKGLFFWEHDSVVLRTSESQVGIVEPFQRVGKGIDGDDWHYVARETPEAIYLITPYMGKTKINGWRCIRLIEVEEKSNSYVHCVVCDGCRMYFHYGNGSVLVAPYDYELNL